VAAGDPATWADDDDLAARLADPVLADPVLNGPAPAAPPDVWGDLVPAWPAPAWPAIDDGPATLAAVEARARDLLDRMTLHEKLHLLSGDVPVGRGLVAAARGTAEPPYVAGALSRLGVPGVRLAGGAQGAGFGGATEFPPPIARGATFDPVLEARVGDAVGAECRALGANLFVGVGAAVLRHAGWGQAHESFGEAPHHVAEMAVALLRGVQRHVMAAVGRLVAGQTEDGRFRVDVRIDADDLRAIDLPPFRRCVEAGAAAVQAGGHRLDGERCGQHHHLLTEVLKEDWGFDGFVASDLVLGVRSARAVAAGLDLELPFHWRFRSLARLVRRGRVSEARVDDAALRVLRQQVRFARQAVVATGVGDPYRYDASVVAGDAHRTLAREVAERSLVLLRNAAAPTLPPPGEGPDAPDGTDAAPRSPAAALREPVLPLDPDRVRSLAVIGALAAVPVGAEPDPGRPRSGRSAPARPDPARPDPGRPDPGRAAAVTVLDGLRAAGERWVINVTHQRGDDRDAARLAAAGADVAVVVAGFRPGRRRRRDWPPGGVDRRTLTLRPEDEALIRTVGAANPRTVVVLLGGGAIVTDAWRDQVGALLMAWYPGSEGGHAVARVLFGEVAPSGRLPSTWPRGAEQLPPFDPDARRMRHGPLHGYRLMEATGRSPAFPFGYGLSYTTFEYGRMVARRRFDGVVHLTVPVINTGTRAGDEVVQVYIDEALGSEPCPLRTLLAFRRVTVTPGTLVNVVFELTPDEAARSTDPASGHVRLHIGRDADPAGHRIVEA
jgi:beta-glucosidase